MDARVADDGQTNLLQYTGVFRNDPAGDGKYRLLARHRYLRRVAQVHINQGGVERPIQCVAHQPGNLGTHHAAIHFDKAWAIGGRHQFGVSRTATEMQDIQNAQHIGLYGVPLRVVCRKAAALYGEGWCFKE